MFNAIQTSLSGLMASTARLNVAASNIANAQVVSSPDSSSSKLLGAQAYIPQRISQSTTNNGGVKTSSLPVNPASLTVYNPSSPLSSQEGFVNVPNVSLVTELTELKRASHSYKANAKVLETLDNTLKSFLDEVK